MLNKWLHFLIYAKIWTIILCNSYYSILAPGTVKSNRNYTVSISLHAADGPATIRVGFRKLPSFYTSQDVILQPFETKSLHFALPKLHINSKCELIAEGVRGLHFKNSTELLVDAREGLKIYIQTSKGIYKPGDLVQFRIIILDEHLKPAKLQEPVGVQIQDSKGHRVKQLKDIQLIKGLFSGNISLSEQTTLGVWQIIVSVSGKYDLREIKPFEVKKYVLPQFSIQLDTADYFVNEDQILPVIVYGKYVYGKYVEGTVTARIMILNAALETQTKDIESHRAKFEFNITKYLRSAWAEPDFFVEATLTDKYSNVSLTTKKHIRHHNQRYKIVVPIEEIEFRDNVPYLIKAKVRYLNDSEVVDRTTPIFMKHGGKVYESLLDEHGSASFIFDYKQDASAVISFQKTSFDLPNLYHNNKPNNESMCNLNLKEGKLHLGKTVEIVVSSISDIPYIVYVLIGHGNIIYTKYVQLKAGQKSYTIEITPTIQMVAKALAAVHYIVQNQLHYCEIEIGFPHEFENKVTVSTPNITVQPSQEVTLNIQAQPQSRVGLLALDLRAHLLNSNYSLNKNDIVRELLNDQSYTPSSNINFGQLAGLVMLTNAETANLIPSAYFGFRKIYLQYRSANTDNSQPQVRTKFPETWIFEEIEISDKDTSLSLRIPDTITTWLVTAISLNENSGFGMMDESLNITVFRPFFISTNFPYSIKRGETVAIPLTIFNYYEQDLACQIAMANTDKEFQFMDTENITFNSTHAVRQVNVSANSGASVKFLVKASKLGQLNVHLIALSSLAEDAIKQQLKVEPEGILIKDNQEVFLKLQPGLVETSSFKAEIPQNIVPESEFLRISIVGDVLVPSLENLNQLVTLPTGCGEQNMVKFAPNILVLDYLKSINQWQNFSNLVVNALNFIEIGYQKELTYRHDSGGFSVFGVGGTESTWLTAYVIRFLIKAVKYLAVEPEIIASGLDFLALKQQNNGEFMSIGHLFYPALQNRYGFTAFVLLTFLESKKYRKQYNLVIQKGLDFLTQNVNNTNDTFALSIMASTLQMAQSKNVSVIRDKLMELQQDENGRKWWTSRKYGQSNDVEITSYALMSILDAKDIEHTSIFRWLLEQRNANGGFKTTQDTVVGLQALVKFTQKYNSLQNTTMNITYLAKDVKGIEVQRGAFEVTANNLMLLQQQELPRTTRTVQYEATGWGNLLLQFSYQYYMAESRNTTKTDDIARVIPSHPPDISQDNENLKYKKFTKYLRSSTVNQSFAIDPIAKLTADGEMLMDICFKYLLSEDLQFQKTNMIILEIHLPSGFVCNPNTLEELLEEDIVTRAELQNSGTKIVIYFDQLKANDKHCLQIQADKVHEVEMLKPSAIEMYDFYNSEYLYESVFYEIKVV